MTIMKKSVKSKIMRISRIHACFNDQWCLQQEVKTEILLKHVCASLPCGPCGPTGPSFPWGPWAPGSPAGPMVKNRHLLD